MYACSSVPNQFTSSMVCFVQLEARVADLQTQLSAGHLTDNLKMEVQELQSKLAAEQEAKAKLTDSNQSLQKVSEPGYGWAGS